MRKKKVKVTLELESYSEDTSYYYKSLEIEATKLPLAITRPLCFSLLDIQRNAADLASLFSLQGLIRGYTESHARKSLDLIAVGYLS